MNRFTTGSVVLIAALAASPPAHALGKDSGLSQKQTKQVRAIARAEAAKVPRGPAGPRGATGPAGVPGPAGMDGTMFLYAQIGEEGFVFDPVGGITNENVRGMSRQVPDGNGGFLIEYWYCFFGLPPVTSGQVTMYRSNERFVIPILFINIEDPEDLDPECPIYVEFRGLESSVTLAASFHIQLY